MKCWLDECKWFFSLYGDCVVIVRLLLNLHKRRWSVYYASMGLCSCDVIKHGWFCFVNDMNAMQIRMLYYVFCCVGDMYCLILMIVFIAYSWVYYSHCFGMWIILLFVITRMYDIDKKCYMNCLWYILCDICKNNIMNIGRVTIINKGWSERVKYLLVA